MFTKIRRLPSPALVVAVAALVAALAGSAVALPGSNSVDRNDIRKNAVAGKKVKNESLTGADVNESTLATVPRAGSANSAAFATKAGEAKSADSAASAQHALTAGDAEFAVQANNANNALTVNGVTMNRIDYAVAPGTPLHTLSLGSGLTLGLGCNVAGQPLATVSSATNDVELQGRVVTTGGTNLTYADDNGFAGLDILKTQLGSGTLTYSNGIDVITMDYGFDASPIYGGANGCAFWATVVNAGAVD